MEETGELEERGGAVDKERGVVVKRKPESKRMEEDRIEEVQRWGRRGGLLKSVCTQAQGHTNPSSSSLSLFPKGWLEGFEEVWGGVLRAGFVTGQIIEGGIIEGVEGVFRVLRKG